MRKNIILTTCAILAIISGLSFLVLSQRSPEIETGPYEALGAVTAEETLKLIAQSDQIVVIAQDTSDLEVQSVRIQLQAFETTAKKKKKGINIITEKIPMDAMMMMTSGGRVPAETFLKTLRKYPQAGAIVLFLGFPTFAPTDLETLRQKATKIVVVAGFRPDYVQLLKTGVIDLAIVPRTDALSEAAKTPRTVREWFDQEYLILTPSRLEK